MSDRIAQQLADLEVKRNRTMADLEAIQAAVESVKKSMAGFKTKQDEVFDDYVAQLSEDEMDEDDRQRTYREWNEFMKTGFDKFQRLAAERERLHVQELILVRMIAEIDARIETLRQSFESDAV